MVIDDVFAVIAEGTRRELLGSLRSGDKSVGALVEELEVSQPTVSKHLKVLREAGLVTMRAEGQKRYYSLQTAPLEEIRLWLSAFELAGPAQAAQPVPAESRPAQVPAGEPSARAGRALFAGRPSSSSSAVPARTAAVRPAAAAAALPPGTVEVHGAATQAEALDTASQNLGRTVGRAAERAADLLGQLPKFRRRRP